MNLRPLIKDLLFYFGIMACVWFVIYAAKLTVQESNKSRAQAEEAQAEARAAELELEFTRTNRIYDVRTNGVIKFRFETPPYPLTNTP